MRLFITGATGQIGRRLVADRLSPPHGDDVVVLSRDAGRASQLFDAGSNRKVEVVQGDPTMPGEWQGAIDGCDAVVHLAGAGIADRRWNAAYKQELIRSRIESTRQVVNAIGNAAKKPGVLINSSAMGFYDDAGDEELTEESQPGRSFLAKMCVEWEAEAARAQQWGVRVVLLRLGIVLDERGGALKDMLLPFRLGLGGPLGHGRQWWPWIHWRDVNGVVELIFREKGVAGAVNVVGPNAVRQREFAKTLGRVLRRPAIAPMPAFALKLMMGEVAEYVMMSQRVVPKRAMETGYRFEFPELESALAGLVKA